MTLYVGAGVAFLAYMAMAVVGAHMLHLQGPQWYIFMGLLSAVGLTGCAVFIYFKTKMKGSSAPAADPAAGGDPGASELDQLVREANSKFAHSNVGQGAGIANLPLVFIVGDRGTSKTTSILQSGLEAELLAGQAYQDNNVVPTRTANIWFARGFAFVEAGGAILGDPSSWSRLVKRLQPGKLKSVGKGRQAPRAVVLCVSLEAFLAPGSSAAVESMSRYLAARLGEISQILGISFPVYVIFSKADRLPFFSDYVRSLTNEESTQVLGATLPIRNPQVGVYAEEQTRALTSAFSNLFYSLCEKRLVYLPREDDAAVVPGAYEFPREFRKLRANVVQFLVDVCRPSQLRTSPFLRGFYFAGVRPVVVNDVASARAAAPRSSQTLEEAGGATRMFRVGMREEAMAQQAVAQSQSGVRKVPQWIFLSQLFNGLILQDSAALGASGASVKTSLLRRVLLATAAGLCFIYCILLALSFFGNRSLENKTLTAAQNITTNDSSVPSLHRLDTLRQSLEQLTDWENDGHPLRLSWGLYTGSKIYPDVRKVYYDKFRLILFGETQGGMLAFLKKTPLQPSPTDDYGFAYNTLKSYLLTTSEFQRTSDKSLQEALASWLLTTWRKGKEDSLSKERSDLAKAQFDFYSRDLPNGNPYSAKGDTDGIERSRLYLSKFSGVERVYQSLLTENAKNHRPVSFNDAFPGTADVVTSTHPVAYAYTKPGSDAMLQDIRKQKFGGEPWVLGNYQAQTVDKATMEKGILDLYTRDYIKEWRTVLKTSKVNPYKDLKDAGEKLNTLTGTQAPLLALFWWTSQNTNVEVPGVRDAFRAVQQVAPPSTVQQYVVPANQIYNGGLIKLQATVAQAANTPNDPAAAAATKLDAQAARQITRTVTAAFPVDNETHLEATVEDLLVKPITNIDILAQGMGVGEINAKAAGFCAALGPLTRKFPFNPAAQPEVTLQELNDIFKPKDGKLWQLYDSTLKPLIQCTATECVANPASPVAVEPAFIRFFSQAAAFSRALYGDAGTDPNFHYTLRPQKSDQVEDFDVTVNGDTAHLNGGGQRSYAWPGQPPYSFKLDLKLAGGTKTGVNARNGLWSVFRFFADADSTTRTGAGYDFKWTPRTGQGNSSMEIAGRPLAYEFNLDTAGAPAVFSKDFLAGLKCVGKAAH